MQFKTHSRLGIKTLIPRINTKAHISVRSDYDSSFGVRAAQFWNILPSDVSQLNPLESFKIGLGMFLEQFPDTPHSCEQQLTAELEGDAHDADVLSTPSQTYQNVPKRITYAPKLYALGLPKRHLGTVRARF